MVYCSECGEKNPDEAKYCFNCGRPLIHEEDIESDVHDDDAKEKNVSERVPEGGVNQKVLMDGVNQKVLGNGVNQKNADLQDGKDVPLKEEVPLKNVRLVGEDVENLEALNKENLQEDMNTLQVCNNEVMELVRNFNHAKMDKNDFDGFLEDMISEIRSKLKALNGKLVCVSPQVMSVTVTQDRENPYHVNITTNLDKERLNRYVETLKARLQENQKTPETAPKAASWRDRCPVCRKGTLSPCTEKKLMGLVNEKELRCQHCGAVFTQKGQKYALTRVSDINNAAWRSYSKQALTESEWTNIANGGMSNALQRTSDLNHWLADARAGKVTFTEPASPVILKKNEKAVLVLQNIAFWEPRAVRQTVGGYAGPTIHVAKGVSFRVGGMQARSESHEELRQIDRGVLTLTTRRIMFAGGKRTINIDLRKILSIEPYKDGIASQRENKQKTEYFLNTDKSSLNITAHGNHYNLPVNGVVMKAIVEGMINQL